MRNYLFLVVDSLNYYHVRDSKLNLMPYLQSLADKGIYCTNTYSQAPYTEAATMPLYAGQNVLDNGGYLKRLKDAPVTIFEAMKEAGYLTYYNSYQPQCYPSSLLRGVDEGYYSVGYDLAALWSYRFSHYAELKKKGLLNDADMQNLQDIMEDNFSEWLAWTDALLNGSAACEMIRTNARAYDPRAVKAAVLEEQTRYFANKTEYIYEVLEQGRGHGVFKIPAYVQDEKIKDRAKMKEIRALFKPLFRDIARMNRKLNFKNNKHVCKGTFGKLGAFFKHPSKSTYKNFLRSAFIAVNAIFDLDLKERLNDSYDNFKNAPSARTHFKHYMDWADKHREQKHFACVHIDDIHNPEIFFTYDSTDMELLEKEKRAAEEYLATVPKDYMGSLTHDLSLRYMDNSIQYLVEEMEKRGLMENTCLIITADHGCSFSFNPFRDSFIINFYLENYQVPFVIYNAEAPVRRIDKLTSTKDIPATIFSLATGKEEPRFVGKSVLGDSEYDHVTIEYCGGGCPDLTRRELMMAAFDKKYFVGALCAVKEEMTEEKVAEVYDLEADPKQEKNLVKEGIPEGAKPLFAALQQRMEQLRQ